MTLSNPVLISGCRSRRHRRWGRVVSCFSCLFVSFVIQIPPLWAASPYQPVYPDPALESWRWRSFPELKGVGLQCMAQDREGNMWFGTDEGVRRYDGVRWTVFTPEDGVYGTPVTALCATRDGRVYAGTSLGISRFSEGGWGRVFPGEGDRDFSISDLMEASDGSVWAGTDRGALRLNGGESTLYTTKEMGAARDLSVHDVYEDREGVMWFGLFSGEIVRCDLRETRDARAWRIYTAEDGLDIGSSPRIVQTRDGTIWTVSGHGLRGVNWFDGKIWAHVHLSELGGDDHNPSILETEDGTLWVGGYQGHLHAFRDRVGNATTGKRLGGGTWTVYKAADVPIPTVRIIGLLEASNGALWMIGRGQEAVRLDYGTFRRMTYEGLNFQCETPGGVQWFLSEEGGVVRYDGKTWLRYGVEDGLMDAPVRLIATREGTLWAAGSHDTTAATARFEGRRWSLQTHPQLSWGINPNSVYESSDGSLWFGAAVTQVAGGVLRFDRAGKPETGVSQSPGAGTWTHYPPSDAPRYVYGIGQTSDGVLWFGAASVGATQRRFDGEAWTPITGPEELTTTPVDAIHNTGEGDLWVGTRHYGVFQFDGKTWTRYDVQDGLADNRIGGILQTDDGSVWVSTKKGTSRFDGRTWTTHALPLELRGLLRQSRDGALWINTISEAWTRRVMPGTFLQEEESYDLRTIRYKADTNPPETEITLSLEKVSQPGNTTLAWTGADPWHVTPDEALQYAWRLDGGQWSRFSHERNHIFELLPSGRHRFEVKARDRDFNEDPTPAVVRFTVVPPVWREPWFVGLMVVVVGVIGFQGFRIVVRDRQLRISNAALSNANQELFALNRDLREKTGDLEAANEQIQAQSRWKSQFLTSMSHELRTPMNAILGFTNLVLRRGAEALPERQKDNLNKVKLGGEYLLSLIGDILDLTDIEAGRLEVQAGSVDVKRLIDTCCATVSPLVRSGVALNYEVADDVGETQTDRARLRQIVINLLGNAIKFTEAGEVSVRVTVEGEQLVIAVSDTGVGIPADALDTIFDAFRQVEGAGIRHKDTGLGLSITKRLTELLGGTVAVESEVGKGSVFTVRVPVVYEEEG